MPRKVAATNPTKKRAKTARPKKSPKKKSGARELLDTGTDKRFVRRNEQGEFKESDDVGKSLRQDRQRKAKKQVKSGYGDRGDRG